MIATKSTAILRILGMAVMIMMVLSTGESAIALPTDQAVEGLFTDAPTDTGLPATDDPTIVRTRSVNINFDVLGVTDGPPEDESAVASALVLNLFEGVVFTALLDRVEFNSSGSFSWIGHLEGVEYSQVILIVKDKVAVGNITTPEAFYQVRYAANGVHVIYEIDQAAFPPDAEAVPVETSYASLSGATDTSMADDGSIIDVMVVYTPAALAAAGGTTAMENLIDLAVAETNQSYENSLITQRLRLVHTAEVSYAETGDMSKDLSRLRNPSDAYMDNVHALRDTYQADLISLMVENGGGYCGIAYMMSSVAPWFESWAFSVVRRDCATGYYSFAHELGHNMGARHDWYVDDTVDSPYTYNHGYVNIEDKWRTIMAYYDECEAHSVYCAKLQYWSNPGVTYGGDTMGVPEGTSTACTAGNPSNPPCDSDNRKTLNNTAYTVANFRSSPGGSVGPVAYDSYVIDDNNRGHSTGNGDGIVNCGESIELYVNLYNQGSETATEVEACISSTDSYVTWLHKTCRAYRDISAGRTGTNTKDFDFAVDPGTPDGHVIHFDLGITTTNGGPWSDAFSAPVLCGGEDHEVFLPLVTKNHGGPALIAEGFESGVMPPPGWTHIQSNTNETWRIDTYDPHSGSYYAHVLYDPALLDQNELLLSPSFAAGSGSVSLWSYGSLYWCRDTYDNCDLEVWFVKGAWGGGDDVYLGLVDEDWIEQWAWSHSSIDFSAHASGDPARIALRYTGNDGAEIAVDDILIEYLP